MLQSFLPLWLWTVLFPSLQSLCFCVLGIVLDLKSLWVFDAFKASIHTKVICLFDMIFVHSPGSSPSTGQSRYPLGNAFSRSEFLTFQPRSNEEITINLVAVKFCHCWETDFLELVFFDFLQNHPYFLLCNDFFCHRFSFAIQTLLEKYVLRPVSISLSNNSFFLNLYSILDDLAQLVAVGSI